MSLMDRIQNMHTPRAGEAVMPIEASISPAPTPYPNIVMFSGGGQNLGTFTWPAGLYTREQAMTVPSISRARDIICNTIGRFPFALWKTTVEQPEPTKASPLPWFDRPDPAHNRNWILAYTTDDLLFNSRAYWRIAKRDVNGYPTAFEWMPFACVSIAADLQSLTYDNRKVPAADVVTFESPTDGLLVTASRTICRSLELDASASRYANNEQPAGYLKQTAEGGATQRMSIDEMREYAAAWTDARRANTTGFLGLGLEFESNAYNPDDTQLLQSRQHEALEVSRLANVPPYMVGAPAGTSMVYSNALTARLDLIDFGIIGFVNTIEETLSQPGVTPSRNYVRLDMDAFLRNPLLQSAPTAPAPQEKPDAPAA